MGSSPDSTEKVLQVVSSHLLDKVAQTSAGTVSWTFLTTLKVNMDSVWIVLVHDVQGCLEELEQCILALQHEPRGPEEPRISDSKVVSDGDDERYDTVGPRVTARAMVQQKVKREQPMAQGGHPQGAPSATEFTTYQPYTQEDGQLG